MLFKVNCELPSLCRLLPCEFIGCPHIYWVLRLCWQDCMGYGWSYSKGTAITDYCTRLCRDTSENS